MEDNRKEMTLTASCTQNEGTCLKLATKPAPSKNGSTQAYNSGVAHDGVPCEILGHIFELVVCKNRHFLPNVSLVCTYWYAVSTATPTLWNNITSHDRGNHLDGVRAVRKVRAHAGRVGAVPISVDLDFRYTESLSNVYDIMEVLHPHLAHCTSFRLSVPDMERIPIVAVHSPSMKDVVESVALRVNPGADEDVPAEPLLIGAFPCLTNVILEQSPLACIFAKAHLPRLRKFNVIRNPEYPTDRRFVVRSPDFVSVLTSHPELDSVGLEWTCLSELDTLQGRTFACTSLKTLSNCTSKMSDFSQLVYALYNIVSFPALTRVEIHLRLASIGQLNDHFGILIPSLRELTLLDCGPVMDYCGTLLTFFEDLPQLIRLGIEAPHPWYLDPDVMKLFNCQACADTEYFLLPNLRELSITGWKSECGVELLQTVRARARAKGVSSIRKLHLSVFSWFNPSIALGLRKEMDEFEVVEVDKPLNY